MPWLHLILILFVSINISLPAFSDSESKVFSDEELYSDAVIEWKIGNPDAPVKIIEYSSYACVFCSQYHRDVFPAVYDKYIKTGKVLYSIRHLSFDQSSFMADVLTACYMSNKHSGTFEDRKIEDIKQLLTSTASNWGYNKNHKGLLFDILVSSHFMTKKEFDSCINDESIQKDVWESNLFAVSQFAIDSTPAFFINGKYYVGLKKISFFDKVISDMGQE